MVNPMKGINSSIFVALCLAPHPAWTYIHLSTVVVIEAGSHHSAVSFGSIRSFEDPLAASKTLIEMMIGIPGLL